MLKMSTGLYTGGNFKQTTWKKSEWKLETYGSLYVTLCFVLCRLYFGVLTFYFRISSFLFMCSVYDVVHFKRRHSRGGDKI